MVKETFQRAKFIFRVLTQRKLDGLDLLEADHVRVEILMMRWRFARGAQNRETLFGLIKRELVNHWQIEETVLYPVCEKILDLRRLIHQAEDDHKLLKALLKEVVESGSDREKAIARMRVLVDEFRHHINREENIIFPRVRLIMKKNQLDKLSRDIRLVKRTQLSKPLKQSRSKTQKIAA